MYRDIFRFFLKDKEYVSKTINHSNIDLGKFPGSNVRQLTKKMESSKSTTRHIKQVASDPQAAQVNWGINEQTSHQARASKKNSLTSLDQRVKRYSIEHKNEGPPYKKNLIQTKHTKEKDFESVLILNTLKVSSVLQESTNAEIVTDIVILQAYAIEGQSPSSPEHPRHIS